MNQIARVLHFKMQSLVVNMLLHATYMPLVSSYKVHEGAVACERGAAAGCALP